MSEAWAKLVQLPTIGSGVYLRSHIEEKHILIVCRNFIISRFTPQMFLTMKYGVYMFFASMMLLSIPFVYFLVTETKGIPLEAMDRLFMVKPTRKAHKTILREVQEEDLQFRHDAEGAGLDISKEHFKSAHLEKVSTDV